MPNQMVAAVGALHRRWTKALDANPIEGIDWIVDPHKNFAVLMKDSVIYKNTVHRTDRELC